jgi:hypothetical protein
MHLDDGSSNRLRERMMTRQILTFCPYDDQEPLGVTLDEYDYPVEFAGDCMHAAMANACVEGGEDLRTEMPQLMAHLATIKESHDDA